MATYKAYSVTDLGPGDGGKGGVVEAISAHLLPHHIIKEGGAQGSHGVVTDTHSFNFSQWGCATFQNVPTHLSDRFIMSPTGVINEAVALRKVGIYNPYWLLTADPRSICATPYHRAWSQLYEISLRDHPHGTVGTGVGKAYRHATEFPNDAIYAEELSNADIVRKKLVLVRDYVREMFEGLTAADVLPDDVQYLSEARQLLDSTEALNDITQKFSYVGRHVNIVSTSDILKLDGCVVIERSHGVLTDAETGIKPYVSNLRTLPIFTRQSLAYHGFSGKLVNLGVHRAYEIRHGAGPMPTASEIMRKQLLPGSQKDDNRWQGRVRVGALDMVLLNRAIDGCANEKFDGLCLTWFDQIRKAGIWDICSAYFINDHLIEPHSRIPTKSYDLVTPITLSFALEDPELLTNNSKAFDFCRDILSNHVDIPLRLVSFGPKAKDKFLK